MGFKFWKEIIRCKLPDFDPLWNPTNEIKFEKLYGVNANGAVRLI